VKIIINDASETEMLIPRKIPINILFNG
jgi:hypothetical protein